MPPVRITTKKFPRGWPTPNGTSSIDVSTYEIRQAAAEVGATSSVFCHPQRTRREIVWRINMILANLEGSPSGWEQSSSYKRLDPSEKSGVSYYLGMVLPAIVAKKCWNTPHLVHVDAVLQILGKKIGNVQRPDLVGYAQGATANSPGRLLLEAKGRTHGFAQPPVVKAKGQLYSAPQAVLQLIGSAAPRIASLAHFENGLWEGYLIDPPGAPMESPYSDEEFQALVDTAYCWPFMEIIKAFPGDRSQDQEEHTVWMPEVDMKISMPSRIFHQLEDLSLPAQPDSLQELWADIIRDPPTSAPVTEGGGKRNLVRIDELEP